MTGADNEYCKTCGHYFKSTGSEPICNYLGDTGHARILKCRKGGVGCTEHTEFTKRNVPRRKCGIIVSPSEQAVADGENREPWQKKRPAGNPPEWKTVVEKKKPTAKDMMIAKSLGISTIIGVKPEATERKAGEVNPQKSTETCAAETMDREKAMLYYNRGCSDAEIGNAVGLSKYQIQRWRRRNHLKSKYVPVLYREEKGKNGD